jgi:hypothetical protein
MAALLSSLTLAVCLMHRARPVLGNHNMCHRSRQPGARCCVRASPSSHACHARDTLVPVGGFDVGLLYMIVR